MDWIQALILGIVQGLTEYLPVSSSGHLTILSTLFGIDGADNHDSHTDSQQYVVHLIECKILFVHLSLNS